MNKKTLLSLMMLCFAFFGVARADELTVHNGTAESSNIPVWGLWTDNSLQHEFVYPASELANMNGGEITTLKFYSTDSYANVSWNGSFRVFLKEVSATTLTSFLGTSDAYLVYEGSLSITSQEMEITLTTPYTYNGGNLWVGVYYTTTTGYSSCNWLGESVTGASIYGRSGNSYTVNAANFLPKTTFTYSICAAPIGLTVSNVTSTTATFSWTENGTSESWYIFYHTVSHSSTPAPPTPVPDLYVEATENPYTLTGLVPNTQYEAFVVPSCGVEVVDDDYYYDYSLTSNTVHFMAADRLAIGSGTASNSYLPTSNYFNYSLTQQIYTTEELGTVGAIESIEFYCTGLATRNLDIYMVSTDKSSFESGSDWISVTQSDLVFSGTVNFANSAWTNITLDTPFLYDGIYNVALIIDDNTGSYGSSIPFYVFDATGQAIRVCNDNTNYSAVNPTQYSGSVSNVKNQIRFTKSELDDCVKPLRLTADEIGPYSATLSWTEVGTSDSWYIYYREAATTSYVEYDTVPVTENPFTLTNLEPYTYYEAFVIPSCGVEYGYANDNLMSNTITFTTLDFCPTPMNVAVSNITDTGATVSWTGYSEAYYVQWGSPSDNVDTLVYESFDNGFSDDDWSIDLTYPWTFVNGHIQSGGAGVANVVSNLYLYKYLDGPGTVEFDAECRGEGSGDFMYDKCIFSIDGEVQFTYGELNGWNHYSFDVAAGEHTFTWKYTKDGSVNPTGDYFAIDNVAININEMEWNDPVTVQSPPYTLTGLNPLTEYYVTIRGVCGINWDRPIYTSWTELLSFSTLGYYTVTVGATPTYGGTVSGGGEFLPGETCTVTAVPNAHFYFYSWYKNGPQVSYDSIYSFTVTENANLVAEFSPITYYAWINSYPQNGGTASFSDHDPVFQYGDTVTLHASPNVGYEFVNWTVWNGNEYVPLSSDTVFTLVWNDDFFANLLEEPGEQDGIAFVANFIGDCMPPTQLTATEVGPNFATLNWTEQGASESWYVFYLGEGINQSPTQIPYDTIQVTENPFTLTGLQTNTTYEVFVVPSCGVEDGNPVEDLMSETIVFTTLDACPIPRNLEVTNVTHSTATVTWSDYNDSYLVQLGLPNPNNVVYETFANGIPAGWTNDATHPWTIVDGHIQSGNAGVSSSTSEISVTMTYPSDGFIAFDAECKGEGTSYYWDHCDFYIDTTRVLYAGANIAGWNHYSFDVASGSHTFTWKYTKDGSDNPTGDYFAVDNVRFTKAVEWNNGVPAEDATITLTDLTPLTLYCVRVQGQCVEGQQTTTDWSQPAFFTTLEGYTITVSANPANAGTVSGGGEYGLGESCTISATANTGYTFINWTKNGQQVSTSPSYTFDVTGTASYVANFELQSFSITVSANPPEGGTVFGGGTYNHGATATLSATPNAGYTFTGWNDGVMDNPRVVDVNGSASYVANFSLNSYTITTSADPTNGGTASGGGNFNHGTSCTLTATPNAGYAFTNWTKNDSVVSTNAVYTFTVTEGGAYVAHFSQNSYTLTINYKYANGTTAAPTHTENVAYGASYSVTSPSILGYTADQEVVSGTMGAGNVTIDVTYNVNSYILTINYMYADGSTAAPTYTQTVDYGDTYSVTSPDIPGYSPSLPVVSGTMGADNLTVNVTYSDNSYLLTINYKYADGTTAAPTYTENVAYGASYSVTSPSITGYTPDQEVVSGTMGAGDVTVDVTYTVNSYQLTINYKYADGSTAATPHTETLNFGASYSVNSPSITGYTPDQEIVSGTMGAGNVTVDVTYTINSYILTINYMYADGSTAAPTYTQTVDYGDTYSVTSPDIPGYSPSLPVVSGTMGADNLTVNVTYSDNSYLLTINYKYADGTTAAPTYTENVAYGAPYSVTSPSITGYTADQEVVSGTMGAGNVTIDVTYTINSYILTINYKYADGTTAATPHTETLNFGASYSVNSPSITGYTPDQEIVSGTMGAGNVTIDVTYTINSYILTINYMYADGTTAATPHTETLNFGASYSVNSPSITGYTPDQEIVSGTMGAGNVTVDVTYTINSYQLTINYKYADGTIAAPSYTETLNYGATYSVTSPDIPGYSPSLPVVSGTMGADNLTVNVTYSDNSYLLTINYKYADGTTAAPTYTENVAYGAPYSVTSPSITGYTPDQEVVSGTMGAGDVTVDVTYTVNSYQLTVNYKYADGTTAAASHTETLNFGASYSVNSPSITGYTPDQEVVSGTMGAGDVTVDVTYTVNSYQLTVNYKYADGTTAAASHTETLNFGASYSVNSPSITGYTPDQEVVSGTMGAGDVTVDVTYNINSYTLTINYKYANGTTAATSHVETLDFGASYSVTSPSITGYTPDQTVVEGTMGAGDVTVDVTYNINSYTLTINYKYANGTTAAASHIETLDFGASYSVTSPSITGYTPDQTVVEGTMGAGDVTVDVTYNINSYTLTINYKYANGTTAATSHTESLDFGASYSVTSPSITGYTPDQAVVEGTMGAGDVTVDVTYNINSYTLTINYKYANGTTAAASHIETLDFGASYSVTSPTITGYTPDQTVVEGTMGAGDVTVDVTYNINSYTLTINYKYANGTTAAASHIESLDFGASYSVTSPTITGYTPDQAVVEGTMGAGDVTVDVTYNINSYTLTINYKYANGATAAASHIETLDFGASYSVTSPSITGYTPDQAVVEGTMGAGDVTVDVTYNINSYTLTINYKYANGTTAAASHIETLDFGASYSVTSPSITGYTPDQAVVTGTMGAGDVTVDVTYNINSYTITATANPTAGGSVSGANIYNHFETCTLVATASTGYTFLNWTENGNVVSTDATYSFTVTGPRTLVANFQLNSYTITATANPSAGGTVSGTGTYNHFQTCTLVAMPNANYNFDNWTKNGVVVSTDASYSFTVTEGGTYVAHFSRVTYQITAMANPTEGGSVSGTGTYSHGTYCTLNATANTGYTFFSWTKNGVVVSSNPSYSFSVTENATYVANFNLNNCQVTVAADPAAGGSVSGGGAYLYGSNCTVFALPTAGYTFTNWTKNGTVVSTDATYTFTVTENVNLIAHFTLNHYNITVSADPGAGGSATGGGSFTYGQTCTLIASANTGYAFVNWTKNGTVVSSNATYNFSVYDDGDYVAHFAVSRHTITVSAEPAEGGHVYGGGTYDYGHIVTLRAYANEGYEFVNWTKNGVVISSNANCAVRVVEDAEYVANFLIHTYGIKAHTAPYNTGDIDGVGYYDYGETCTLTVTPHDEYEFVNWTLNGQVVSEEESFSFVVTEERTYVANLQHVESVVEQGDIMVTLYPNPAKRRLTIEASEPVNMIEIYNTNGALIDKRTNCSDKFEISVETYASGTYMIRLTTDSAVEIRRFVKE